ncbi:MAG: condensation domain-containing protein [Acidobacteriota bacterium]
MELPIQYADFAYWQRNWLKGQVLEEQLGYWKQKLEGAAVLELPTDRPRPALRRYRGAAQTFAWRGKLVESLQALGRTEDATLFMALMAVFQVLLGRCSSGTPPGRRDAPVLRPAAPLVSGPSCSSRFPTKTRTSWCFSGNRTPPGCDLWPQAYLSVAGFGLPRQNRHRHQPR